ncbi:DUF952 domain-containing protein [Frankia sp. AgKG'84/4]|uniref:DUF952 domain-containing protein n=1 Tax=Frankia sp. AgKG'84/4 TaxID=573490 RepID=UPI00200F23BF|nr:DUF952 domain-containing protein [Frankia sp. AgKG'84/4]MCL9794921.1 DUF952 domain-containing protein [Frankia sp. AgKG'84/4]
MPDNGVDEAGTANEADEQVICHLVGRSAWAVGAAAYRPASLGTDGFIHFSTPEQVAATANRFYQGRDDLLLVIVDPSRLHAPLRWEPPAAPTAAPTAAPPSAGELFPHLYGPIDAGAVAAVVPFPPAADGTFAAPPALW